MRDLRDYTRRIDPKFIPPVNHVVVSGAIVSQLQMRRHPKEERWDKCSFVLCNYQAVWNTEKGTQWVNNILYVKCWGHLARRIYDKRHKWDPVIVEGKLVHFDRMDGRKDVHIAAHKISLISTIMHKETFEIEADDVPPFELPDDAWFVM